MKALILIITALVANKTLTVQSPAFTNNGMIPAKYSCGSDNINPELNISGIPAAAKYLALIIDDPDAPKGTFDHWVMWNIPAANSTIKENSAPGTQGKNGKNQNKYTGPCPPSGTHHYHFKVYALDGPLSLAAGADKSALLKAMEGHILASGELVGLFQK